MVKGGSDRQVNNMWIALLKLIKELPVWVWILAAVLVFGGGRLLWLEREKDQLEAQVVAVGLAVDSIEAVGDSLRNITAFLEEELDTAFAKNQVLDRRVLQVEQERDDIDAALGRSRVLNGQLGASVARLEALVNAPVTVDEDDVRLAHFLEYIEPYTVDVMVGLPAPPAEGIADISVELDPINAGIRVQCGQKDELTGIRPASVLWNGPTWLVLSDLSVEQDPEVCNEEAVEIGETQKSTLSIIWTWTQRVGLVALGVAIGR